MFDHVHKRLALGKYRTCLCSLDRPQARLGDIQLLPHPFEMYPHLQRSLASCRDQTSADAAERLQALQ